MLDELECENVKTNYSNVMKTNHVLLHNVKRQRKLNADNLPSFYYALDAAKKMSTIHCYHVWL